MYTVVLSSKAIKALQKLDRPTSVMLYNWIKKNLEGCSNPRAHGKGLTGNHKGYWRYRVGTYRIIAEIDDKCVKIAVINVGHRRDVYS
ncbi:MAG: type II toxin-antitoxin system RelE/ParE family toxin [Clostridia bacterium]|nr:type II toxin-antitoxin system RelE/ParE family toxin [Clostridia bacterium]